MNAVWSLPLLGSWAIPAMVIVALLALGIAWITALGSRLRHRMIVVSLAALSAVMVWFLMDRVMLPFGDPIGWFVWGWAGTLVLALGWVGVGLAAPSGGLLRRALAGLLVGIAITLSGTVAVNAHFGAYPTLGDLTGANLSDASLKQVAGTRAVRHSELVAAPRSGTVAQQWIPPTGMPKTGSVARMTIPGKVSGFVDSTAYIYLPPAYLTAKRPALPVLIMLAGLPGSPSDWVLGGNLAATMDAFAATHHGLAPVVVMPDQLGGGNRNLLCSDTKLSTVGTYLERDVPNWITRHLQVSTDHTQWAVGGLSAGGTCALQLATRNPDTFPTFLDYSGELNPRLAVQDTVSTAFGGKQAAYDRNNPSYLFKHRRYPQLAGVFVVGAHDAPYIPQVKHLAGLAKQAGVNAQLRIPPGNHGWTLWRKALATDLPWLAVRLRLVV